jgi:hypothetical protein
MMPEDLFLYAGAFLMPTLAHALMSLVIRFTDENDNAGLTFGMALAVPIGCYLFFQIILPFWQPVHNDFSEHAFMVLFITITVAFFFFLCRTLYILTLRKSETWLAHRHLLITLKILIALVFPVLGLYLNNHTFDNIFGDFSNPWFYLLAITNGVAVCIPDFNHKTGRLLLFLIRSITFSFIVYFFFVLLPYLPLSVPAIIFVGTGFLMLTPLVLLIIQVNIITRDMEFFRNDFSVARMRALLFAAMLVIPLVLTWSYHSDKQTLTQTLAYVYEGDLSGKSEQGVDGDALKRLLENVRENKGGRSWSHRATPYLSTYYNWLVLDNLTLSQNKIDLLERIFMDKPVSKAQLPMPVNATVNIGRRPGITRSTITSTYDHKQSAWVSDVDLEITNKEANWQEFTTSFTLPEGAWITDYYLVIGDEKVKGILSEKKASTWIYQQITSRAQDPGILNYVRGNEISFRVFPFAENETRKTGFRIIHREPVSIEIDKTRLLLGNTKNQVLQPIVSADGNTVFISSALKNQLPEIKRKPYYHFIVDCSAGQKEMSQEYVHRLNNFLQKHKSDFETNKFTLANMHAQTYDSVADFRSRLNDTKFEGGFYLQRAIEKILFASYHDKKNAYPVIVVITDAFGKAIVTNDLSDMRIAFPESDFFYELSFDSNLIRHSLTGDAWADRDVIHPVVAFPDSLRPEFYLRKDDQPSVVIKGRPASVVEKAEGESQWQNALQLHGRWLSHVFYPQYTAEDWLPLVKTSFASHTMTPVTSFISLENEAQRKMLLKKQEEVLHANKSLDLDSETRMSEPGFYFVGGFLVLMLIAFRKKLN